MVTVDQISAHQLLTRLQTNSAPILIDTRSRDDFASWHIDGAINYRYSPDDSFDLRAFEDATGVAPSQSIITICGKGLASHSFAEDLVERGYEDVSTVQDGMRGWSRVYEVNAIPTRDPEIDIMQVYRPAKGCIGYMVGWGPANEAAVVDPTRHLDEVFDLVTDTGHEITHVIDTHIHADHLSGGRRLAEEVGATYYLSERAVDRSVRVEFQSLKRNEVIHVGPLELKAIATPGHTTDMMSLLVNDEAVLTGDSLFVDSVGRTELQYDDGHAAEGARLLYHSLHATLLALPDAVTVLPGHAFDSWQTETDGIFASVGELRRSLSILQLDEASFVERLTVDLPPKPPNYETIIEINSGRRENPSPDEAFELELGPNQCAVTDA